MAPARQRTFKRIENRLSSLTRIDPAYPGPLVKGNLCKTRGRLMSSYFLKSSPKGTPRPGKSSFRLDTINNQEINKQREMLHHYLTTSDCSTSRNSLSVSKIRFKKNKFHNFPQSLVKIKNKNILRPLALARVRWATDWSNASCTKSFTVGLFTRYTVMFLYRYGVWCPTFEIMVCK